MMPLKKELDEWDTDNSKIITWIANSSSVSISTQLGKFETTEQVWDFLARRYV